MRRRLAEVARHVGVSEATVSRVLNQRPGVSDATRDAVLTALDVLGYERPTQLRGERARLVGLVLPELQNPIFPAFADVIGGALAQHGFTPVLCTRTVGGFTEAAYVDLLFDQQVSGVVFAGGLYAQADAPHGHYAKLAERNLPVVFINAAADWLQFPRVSCDDAMAAEQAVDHLVALGHRNIGMLVGPSDHVPSNRKVDGARAAAARHGVTIDDERIGRTMFSAEGGQAASTELLGTGVSAIVCASDPLALGAVRAVRRSGRTVPGDVSIVGFDDSAFMKHTDPPMTTVRQPIESMGRAAVERLVSQLDGRRDGPTELLFAPELVVRASTGPA
ncbi:LacI family DNA-binding transcriptional regulator [Desertimonas flava]|uniref:LacI family DNA-binding transcriptional regulator n=1 Tax=Desertimonas flava TaxID=2064846 RepID=UPI000E357EDC|nr:LacI family DNA-binding transcriptional regulator [Desertimonas flava]